MFGADELEDLDYSPHHGRLVAGLLAEERTAGLAGVIVTFAENIRWLTGFSGSAGIAVAPIDEREPVVLVTDGRYVEQATIEAARSNANVRVVERRTQSSMREAVAEILVRGDAWGFESGGISLAEYEALISACNVVGRSFDRAAFVDASNVFSNLRRTKSRAELQRIERAAAIADSALADVAHLIVAGTTEREFRNELDSSMRRHGADDVSFPTIVAAGPNAALPHHHPSDRQFRGGDAVVVDFGALVDGYHSDMTRTFVIDGPGADAMRVRHDAVRRACEAGVAVVRPGVTCSEIDAACRSVLAPAGLEDELTHGVGHGVGLQIHESPWVNPRSSDVLRPGDVVTVEPGAYRVGLGGVRVEELLAVTESGHLVLTKSPKEPTCPQFPPTISRTGSPSSSTTAFSRSSSSST